MVNPGVARVLKRLHYPPDVILICVRWYVAYPLSLRQLEEMMAERGIWVDHSTVEPLHKWNNRQRTRGQKGLSSQSNPRTLHRPANRMQIAVVP